MSHDHIHVINYHAVIWFSIVSVTNSVVKSNTNTDYSSQPHVQKDSTNIQPQIFRNVFWAVIDADTLIIT
jgi:hypothetical protein